MLLRKKSGSEPNARASGSRSATKSSKATAGSKSTAGPKSTAGKGAKPGKAGSDKDGPGRLAQIKLIFTTTRKQDPKLIPWMLLGLAVPTAAGLVIGFVLGPLWMFIPLGVLLGATVALNVLVKRFQRVAYAEMEGKPGAALAIVERLRGDWRVTETVQFNRNQDVVHRVIGRCGVVLLAEGSGRGPRDLLGNEVRRVRRVAPDAPLHDIVVGYGEGEVPLKKLQITITKLPRVLKGAGIDALDKRLRALGGATMPLPKGPVPTRMPRGRMR
ncbi:MAG: DUF4191 domain-containing protein [Frankiaceae bacterium]